MVGTQQSTQLSVIPELAEKVVFLRDKHFGAEVIEILQSPTPPEFIKWRKARGGRELPFIPGPFFIRRLNDALGLLWSYDITKSIKEGKHLVVEGRLSVKLPGKKVTHYDKDGKISQIVETEGITISKTQYGSAETKTYAEDKQDKWKKGDIIDLGDDYKGAATDAMKKCATLLGIGLDVYGMEAEAEDAGRRAPKAEQLDAFNNRAASAGLEGKNLEDWVKAQTGLTLAELDGDTLIGLIPSLVELYKKNRRQEEHLVD